MKIDESYLKARHDHWKQEIGKAGIWDPDLFQKITIKLRPKSKNYNGLFSRKIKLSKGTRVIEDRIFIYRNSGELNPGFIDNVLVHEMIHQYIIQNKIKDTRSHGKVFKSFMTRINNTFPDSLSINIRDINPGAGISGEGSQIHKLVLAWNKTDFYCCKIHPSRLTSFEKLVKDVKKRGVFDDYFWAESNDLHFENYVKCMKRLSGTRMPRIQLKEFCEQYHITKTPKKNLWQRILT